MKTLAHDAHVTPLHPNVDLHHRSTKPGDWGDGSVDVNCTCAVTWKACTDLEVGEIESWFISSLFIIRVPFFLLFGFSKGALK